MALSMVCRNHYVLLFSQHAIWHSEGKDRKEEKMLGILDAIFLDSLEGLEF